MAVVILTWNAIGFSKKCLGALRELTDHPNWRVIVVDNGSTDGTPEWLSSLDWVTLVRNRRNLGFTKGCNIGITATVDDEDVVLMNNDVVVTDPHWLSKLQDTAQSSERNGVVGCRLVDGSGSILHLGAFTMPLTLMGHQLGGFERDVNQCNTARVVESVVFAQVYIRRDCLDAVGPLDEQLFAYFDDSDFCLRAQRAGYEVICDGTVTSTHYQSTSTRENRVDFWSVYGKSRDVFTAKWSRWLEHDRYDIEIGWHSVVNQPMGYAVQSRLLMKSLHYAGVKVAYRNAYNLVDDEDDIGDFLLEDLMKRAVRTDVTQVALCQADAFFAVEGRHTVGWTMLEVTGLPPTWVAGCNSMDEVWVPATFNVATFRSSGVTVPIHVMPLGVDIDYFNPAITGYPPRDRFTFLSVFEWGERKAPEVLLRAFAEEFGPRDDVVLVLAVTNTDPYVDVEAQIAAMCLPAGGPVVVMLNPNFSAHQMGSLYRSANAFVLATRGEGWGMPVLEAMACGLPVIATRWSGPADFLHDGVGFPLEPVKLVPAEARCAYYAGFEWADPDVDQLRALMRQVVDDPDSARAKGMAAATEVASRWTWQHAAARVKKRLLELG